MNTRATVAALLLLVTALASPARLRAADAKANLLKPSNQVDSWRFEQHEAGKGKIAVDGDAITLEVTEAGAEAWHVQAVQAGLDLVDGKEYVLSFKAKASADRSVQVNAMVDQEDWHAVGLAEQPDLGKDWKDFTYTFKGEQTAKSKNRISFLIGNEKGKIWLKDVTLTEK